MKITQTASKYVRLANCNFAQPQACHNVTSPRCMLFISWALLILANHNAIGWVTAFSKSATGKTDVSFDI